MAVLKNQWHMRGIVNAGGVSRSGIVVRRHHLHLLFAGWVWSLALCLPLLLLGQSHSYRFQHLTIDDGLSQNLVYSIVQDDRGFMWFGTNDGLNRYDGYEFKVYNHLPGDTTSLVDNEIRALFVDSRGELWVGAGGLNRYDPRKDRFERVLTADDLPGNLSTLQIYDLKEDRNGHLWIAIRNAGIFRLEIPKERKAAGTVEQPYRLVGPYLISDGGEEIFTQAGVHQLMISGGYLWVSHEEGVSRLAMPNDGQLPGPGLFESVPIEVSDKEPALFSALAAAAEGGMWIGTSFGLVHVPDPAAPQTIRYFPYPPGLFEQDWEGLARKIVAVGEDRLWIATYHGVLVFNIRTGTYERHLLNNPGDPESLGFNNVTDLFVDRGGVIWLGTSGMGVDKCLITGKPFRHYLDKHDHQRVFSVYDLVEDKRGRLWAALNGGDLFVLDRETGTARSLSSAGKNWVVDAMTIDRQGKLWINHNNRFLVNLDPLTETWKEVAPLSQYNKFVESDSVWSVYVDADNQPWVCNTTTLGRFDPDRQTIEQITLPRFDLEKVESFLRDPAGRFWIATLQGLLRYELSGEWRFFQAAPLHPDSLRHHRLKSLLLDPDQPDRYLWIGSGGDGLSRLDIQENSFRHYTEADGLCDAFIYGLLADEGGDLWISTNRGLARFDREKQTFTNYYVEDGLQSNEFNSRSYYRSPDGELFFGGINGINAFFPDRIQPNPHVPPVVITEMQLSYESLSPGRPGSPLRDAVLVTEALDLAHHQNHVAFEFAALDFALPEKNRYRYQLVGFDADWVDAGAMRRATYTNLPPGDYTFRVQGANNDGVWNEEAASVRLRIAPSPWRTWWAYSIYVYLLLVATYAGYRSFIDRRDMREELRLKELEKQKLAELDRFKSEFFASVSHEFRTPLTLIQMRIDELLKLLKRDDLREKLLSMQKSSQQLLRLIEQLLDIARLEASKMKLLPQWSDLTPFVSRLVASLQSAAERKGVALAFRTNDESLSTAFDPDALQKILQNLISNAIKFTPPGGSVKVGLESVAGNLMRLTVSDTGIGIPDKDLPHVFERFYQVESDAARPEKGFGLGLALVRELVTLLEGSIEVKSEVGKGTLFSVLLPLGAKPPEQPALSSSPAPDLRLLNLELAELSKAPASPPGSLLLHTLSRRKEKPSGLALIVEDNVELRQYIANMLRPDYRILEAKDGEEGLDLALRFIPDIIVSDVMMPRMDGFELSERLRADQRTCHIPIVLLTARAELDDRIRGLEIGIDDYLIKPFHERELKTRMANLIRRREQLKRQYSQSLLGPAPLPQGDTLDEQFLLKVRKIIEKNLEDENFSVEVLAKAVNMSASQLYRKLKALTELSTVQLIQHFRLERAAALLRQGHNVTEVAYSVGLRSPAYFSQLFKKHYGCSPKEYEGV